MVGENAHFNKILGAVSRSLIDLKSLGFYVLSLVKFNTNASHTETETNSSCLFQHCDSVVQKTIVIVN